MSDAMYQFQTYLGAAASAAEHVKIIHVNV